MSTLNPVDVPSEPLQAAAATLEGKRAVVRVTRWRSSDALGIAWLHGQFQVAVFRRQTMGVTWTSPTPVVTFEEFENALDAALVASGFAGTEVFLVLEHDEFLHQAELAPAFSDSAAKNYLRGRVMRHEADREPVLWVSQRTLSVRKESAFLLHLLPTSFYGRLSGLLHARRLDLTRILPLIVPLQFAQNGEADSQDQPRLIAAAAGNATTFVVGRGDGQLLFARTMLARWETDSARIAVEINRSMLYAKQQFGTVVDRVLLLGGATEESRLEVLAKCGNSKEVLCRSTSALDWLQAVAKLPARHPVNLVAGHLGRKRRNQFYRRALLAGCWLGLCSLGLDAWTRTRDLNENEQRLARLHLAETTMLAERDRLKLRNAGVAHDRELTRQVVDERLPDVPARFLAYLGTVRPADLQFTEISTKWDPATGKWSFRLEGQIEGDDETARDNLAAFQKLLSKSPLRARFNDGVRSVVPMPAARAEMPASQRFAVEGGLFED